MLNIIELLQHDIKDVKERREQIEELLESIEDVDSRKYDTLVNECYNLLGRIHGLEIAINHIEMAVERTKEGQQ